ncbi:MAG: HNH endonuclease [Actinobacteria bacterium]|nr:HNH endonuclease [Actinomycetota bacterium]
MPSQERRWQGRTTKAHRQVRRGGERSERRSWPAERRKGCLSRHSAHHITPYSQGGPTDPENLTTLCWYHHHVVIHGMGYRIDPDTPPQRRRFLKPGGNDPP